MALDLARREAERWSMEAPELIIGVYRMFNGQYKAKPHADRHMIPGRSKEWYVRGKRVDN